ncbi:MAG: 50S ribosomal protein L28 [Candidatus Kerfeldbacteria bacterium]|nr:50S ribosomal protein L28 [Candidatus Kerfeldbacteria bacterium]
MARICERCGRGSLRSFSRSHSNIATIKRQHLNLQKTRLDGRSVRMCTSCIRTVARSLAKPSRAT